VLGGCAQVGLLAALDVGVAGWLAGLAWTLATAALLDAGLARHGRWSLSPADRVTLARATIVGGVAALVADSFSATPRVVPMVALACVALVLDAVDGAVARATSTVTPLGARFDMEVDAFLILVLSTEAARTFGAWVLLSGAARYLLWIAERFAPWLRKPVPPRYWRKTVAAIQGITLTVAVAGVLPFATMTVVLALAVALLAESFGRDVWTLRHQARRRADPTQCVVLSGRV
jgi:phosphatidylglycerophosphate synthase